MRGLRAPAASHLEEQSLIGVRAKVEGGPPAEGLGAGLQATYLETAHLELIEYGPLYLSPRTGPPSAR